MENFLVSRCVCSRIITVDGLELQVAARQRKEDFMVMGENRFPNNSREGKF